MFLTRLAPIAAALCVAAGFLLALTVLVSAVTTSQSLLGHARLEQQHKAAARPALVQSCVPTLPHCG